MAFFNTLAGIGFVVGEEHTTTAKMEAKTNKGERMVQAETQLNIAGAKGIYFVTMFNSANSKQTVNKIVLQ